MAPLPAYGSISQDDEEVELLPPPDQHGQGNSAGDEYIGTIDARSPKSVRCISYALAASLVCVFSARYWHAARGAESYDNGSGSNSVKNNNNANNNNDNRVPMPPPLSNLDPSEDLGFRSTTRKGLASPSKAWGEHYLSQTDGEFTPLPTNEWYLVSRSSFLMLDICNTASSSNSLNFYALQKLESPIAPGSIGPQYGGGGCTCLYYTIYPGRFSAPTS